jgi:hypothetical protein
MMGLGLSIGCSCCGCDIGEDDFDRADGDSLGGDWSERSGDADIVSNQLKFISAGIARYETAHPNGTSGNQYIHVLFELDSTSSYARGIVCMSDDSNYLYAGVEQVSSCWMLRLRQVSGGADTSLADDLPLGLMNLSPSVHTLRVCWNPTTTRPVPRPLSPMGPR